MSKILVAYASKHHATAKIAEAIGEMLQRTDGHEVDVLPVETVQNPGLYDVVVLGSAVYMGKWQKAAAKFLKAQTATLAQRPVWLFSSGPTDEGNPEELLNGWTLPEDLKAVADQIQPRDVAVFHGRLDPESLSLMERVIIKGVKAPVGDFRDWEMIRGWAAGIAEVL